MNILSLGLAIGAGLLFLSGILQGIVAAIELTKHVVRSGQIKKWSAIILTCIILAVISGYASYLTYVNSSNTTQPDVRSTAPSANKSIPQPLPTAIPTPTNTPFLEPTPTATSLPTGIADCSGGPNVGWNRWISNPNNAWSNNGTTVVNTEDEIRRIEPTFTGPTCGLLKRGSRISITFTIHSTYANLYLIVQG